MLSSTIPSNFLAQLLDGFRSIFNPKIIKEISSSHLLSKIFWESFRLNVSYLLFLLILRHWILLPLVISLFLRRFISNTLINFALIGFSTNENPFSQPYKSCGCDSGAILQASLASLVIFLVNSITMWLIYFLPFSGLIGWLGLSLIYGQSLLEIKLSAVGMCTRHRSEILVKNNGYAIGIGLALFWIMSVFSSFIYNMVGIKGYFIDDAIFSLVYPYFMMAIIIREKSLPSDCHSIDIFHYHRTKIPPKVKTTLKFLGKQIQNSVDFTWYQLWINIGMYIPKWINVFIFKLEPVYLFWVQVSPGIQRGLRLGIIEINRAIPKEAKVFITKLGSVCGIIGGQILRFLIYDPIDDWRYWKTYRISQSLTIFVQAYGRPVKDKFITIRQYTKYSSYIRVIPEAFIKWLTSEDNRILIQLIFNERIKYPLDIAIDFIENLERVQASQVKVKVFFPSVPDLIHDNYVKLEEEQSINDEFEFLGNGKEDEEIKDFENINSE